MNRRLYAQLMFVVLVLLAINVSLTLGSGFLSRYGLADYHAALTLFRCGILTSLVTVGSAILALGLGLYFRVPNPKLVVTVGALAVALVIVGIGYSFKTRAAARPMIHDITTNTESPPQFVAIVPLRGGATNSPDYGGAAIARQQHEAYPDIQPLRVALAMPLAFQKVAQVADILGWDIIATDAAAGRLEATDTTIFFGFKDDIVILATAERDGQTLIQMRSASRVGLSDFGSNAARIHLFLTTLSQLLEADAG